MSLKLTSFFREGIATLRGNGRDETFVIGSLISTDQCIASTFYVTGIGRMLPTRCILLCTKARDIPVNHSRPLVKINAHSGKKYQTRTDLRMR